MRFVQTCLLAAITTLAPLAALAQAESGPAEADNELFEKPDGASATPWAEPGSDASTAPEATGNEAAEAAPTSTEGDPDAEERPFAAESEEEGVGEDAPLDAPRARRKLDAPAEEEEGKAAPSPRGKNVGGHAQWDDAQDMGKMIGHGSIGVCEALTTPLSLIPSVGTVIGFVLEIACLYPGALSIDYVALFHGKAEGQLWQAVTAVILAKAWRVGTRFAAIIGILSAGAITLGGSALMLGGLGLTSFLSGADILTAATPLVWVPTILGTVLVLSGVGYIGLRKLRKYGQSKIYDWVYVGLTDDFKSTAAQKEAQDAALVHPPLAWWERAWVLMAMADGSEAETHPSHWIPVVGRIIKSGDQAAALKEHMRRVGKDTVGEEPIDLEPMDRTIDTLAAFEGGLGAMAEAALIIGGVLSSVGLAMSAAYFLLDTNLLVYALATTGVGLAAMTAGGAGVTFLLLRELPKFFRPFFVPLAYGPFPYEWVDDKKDAQKAASDDEDDDEME